MIPTRTQLDGQHYTPQFSDKSCITSSSYWKREQMWTCLTTEEGLLCGFVVSEKGNHMESCYLLNWYSRLNTAILLLDKGADPNCCDIDGKSPFHMAVEHNH